MPKSIVVEIVCIRFLSRKKIILDYHFATSIKALWVTYSTSNGPIVVRPTAALQNPRVIIKQIRKVLNFDSQHRIVFDKL